MDDPAWHLAFGIIGIIGMCVSPRLTVSGEDRRTERGRGNGESDWTRPDARARVEDGTAFFDAAPPCQTRGVGRKN
jgi:hypothetical protein